MRKNPAIYDTNYHLKLWFDHTGLKLGISVKFICEILEDIKKY